MFGQTFEFHDLATIALLVVLESLLSIDNALVLGILVNRVRPQDRGRVLYYGLFGAFVLRLAAIFLAAILIRVSIVKLAGALYLLWVSFGYFFKKQQHGHKPETDLICEHSTSLWRTIAAIEFTDLAFAVDSVLAAVALVGPPPPGWQHEFHPKLWVVILGGIIGLVLMRFAAAGLSKVLERFPRLHLTAYLLVMLIGLKLLVDWAANNPEHPHRINFSDPGRIEFWTFWGAVLACIGIGLLSARRQPAPTPQQVGQA